MKTQDLIKKIEKIPNGRFFRLRYMSPMKVLARYAKQGIQIFKLVETTTRTGIQYSNIKGVIPKSLDQYDAKKQSSWSWVIKNKIKHNTNTRKDYMVVYPLQNQKSKNSVVKYLFIDSEMNVETFENIDCIKDYLQPSQLTNKQSTSGGKVINIELSNILSIS